MLTYHEAHDGEDPRRARRSVAARGGAARNNDLRADARGSAGAPRRRAGGTSPRRRLVPKRTGRHLRADRGDPGRRGGAIPLLVDSGPLIAHLDADDLRHAGCRELLETYPGPLIVPALCVTEVAYLVGSRGNVRAELRFLEALIAGSPVVEQLHPADLPRVAELVAIYRELPLGTVDASVVAAAERLGVTAIATLDRRDFSVVRPAHVDAFELLP